MTIGEGKAASQREAGLTVINTELPRDVWRQKEAIAYVTDKKLVSKTSITYLPGTWDSVFDELFKLDRILLPV